MDEYLIQLDNIIKQTTNSLHSNNMFSTENMVETIKEISKNLKVINKKQKPFLKKLNRKN